MAYLDTYTTPLTAATAAHLLRRATFGPTQQEIADFTGKTASQAVDILISNSSFYNSPSPPIELDVSRIDAGQQFLTKPFVTERGSIYFSYIKYWWLNLMVQQNNPPSILEKLVSFWQNHFVVVHSSVEDYRFMYRYLTLLRSKCLGNFKELVIEITKDPGMLIFQNGNENSKEQPNENFARELQELFTVGQKDSKGNNNYTEDDVKAAARVLTGWQVVNRLSEGSTSFGSKFNPDRHDSGNKIFSTKYNSVTIFGKAGTTAGDEELMDLATMLLSHQESSKFICRKFYRWYVNPEINGEIEENIIEPLASFFRSSENNYAIAPMLKKLLSSSIFYDSRNIGSIVKSPAELMIGAVRQYGVTIPSSAEPVAFEKFMSFLNTSLSAMQQNFLNQPSVFGFPAYYQTGFSKNWINENTLGIRGSRTDALVDATTELGSSRNLAIDILGILRKSQKNFSDVTGTPGLQAGQALDVLTLNIFAIELQQIQKDFLIDSIMMMNSSPRTTWDREWNAYRTSPSDTARQNTVLWRCRTVLKYIFRLAEYQIF